MSWYKRRPRVKEPPKHIPRETSPATEKLLKEAKRAVREKGKTND